MCRKKLGTMSPICQEADDIRSCEDVAMWHECVTFSHKCLHIFHIKLGWMQHVFHILMQRLNVENVCISIVSSQPIRMILHHGFFIYDQLVGDLSPAAASASQHFTKMSQKWGISTKSSKMGDTKMAVWLRTQISFPINMRLHLHQRPGLCHLKESG